MAKEMQLPEYSQFNGTYNTTSNLDTIQSVTAASTILDKLMTTMTSAMNTATMESEPVSQDFTTTPAPTVQDMTTSKVQSITMTILRNMISTTPISSFDDNGSDPNHENFPTENYSVYNEFNSLQENSTDSNSHKRYTVPVPGSSEVIIIIAIVFVLLYIAAKYIGCTLSHWPFCSKCFKHRGSDNYQTGGSTSTANHHHHFGHRYRQEYSRRDIHYAVYSRPTTAYPRPMTAYAGSGGLSGFQDPGFSYNSSFDMNNMEHCKVVVNGQHETEEPPTYDSIVPSYTTQNRYTYSSTR